ncbi:MAG: hypothetical protein IT200_07720 [Thermoleophilia bacterium]|nr:hypothetical protein [Thermoleophilia bacterium]
MRWPSTRCTSRVAAAAAVLLLAGAAGCGDDAAQVTPTQATTAGPATTTAPGGPPPVRVIGETGETEMVGYGGCWSEDGMTSCGDPVWPECPSASLPDIPAFAGDELTFVLPFGEVTSLTLTTGDGTTVTELDPKPRVDWNVVVPDGPIVLRAEVPGRGDPAWAACLLRVR